ncbi:ABC transporter permease [Pseudoxanthobacter sp.]|uniref:ABC transporter permease n=1 Tax=Pseudoxanthobacter sp. TaxID=1925742 RepID=UPI002FE13A96
MNPAPARTAEPAGPMPPPPATARLRTLLKSLAASSLPAVALAFAASVAAALLLLEALGFSAAAALPTLFASAFGSRAGLADTLVFMTPRLLVALGAMVALRCGFFNLGGEGQLQLGAIGAVLPAVLLPPTLGPLLLPLSILSAALFGAVFGLIPAVLKLWRGADEIISTLMLNFVGIYLCKYLVQGPLQPPDSDFNMSAKIADGAALPVLVEGTRLHGGVVLALVLTLGTWALLYRTAFGLRLRAAGLSPRAARLQGYSIARLILASMAISGALGGLAGAVEVLGVQYRLIDGFSAHLGFDGLAIALLGGLEPAGVLLVALYFGAINSGIMGLQAHLSVPAALAMLFTSLPILLVAGVHGWRLVKGRHAR